jgi:hypothetical protein
MIPSVRRLVPYYQFVKAAIDGVIKYHSGAAESSGNGPQEIPIPVPWVLFHASIAPENLIQFLLLQYLHVGAAADLDRVPLKTISRKWVLLFGVEAINLNRLAPAGSAPSRRP